MGSSCLLSFFEALINGILHRAGNIITPALKILPSSSTAGFAKGSIFFKPIFYVFARYEVLTGISILLIAIVDHRFWNNIYSTVIVFFLFGVYLFRISVKSLEKFSFKPLDTVFILFAAAVTTALFTGIFPKQSLRFFIFYATCFVFVLVITMGIKTAKELDKLVRIMLAGIFLTALYAIYQRIAGIPFDPSLTDLTLNQGMPGRAFSTMQNPNNYAEVLVLTLPFFAAVILNAKNLLTGLLFSGLGGATVLALLTTGSRSSWIGLAVAFFVFVFLKERRLIPVFMVLGIMSLPVIRVAAPSVYLRAMTIFNAGSDSSFSYRGLIFDMFKPMLKDFWVTGIGLGTGVPNETFMKIFHRYPLDPTMWTYPPHTHNLYLQVWIETGLAGILTFIWFIARMIKKGMKSVFGSKNIEANHIIMAGISGLSGSLVMGLAEYTWFYPRAMLFFWIAGGITMAGIGITAKEDSP